MLVMLSLVHRNLLCVTAVLVAYIESTKTAMQAVDPTVHAYAFRKLCVDVTLLAYARPSPPAIDTLLIPYIPDAKTTSASLFCNTGKR